MLATGRLIVSGDVTSTLFSSGHNIAIEEQDPALCAALTLEAASWTMSRVERLKALGWSQERRTRESH